MSQRRPNCSCGRVRQLYSVGYRDPHTLKTFVGNRVSQILSVASAKQWKHVKSLENPADLGSRHITHPNPNELNDILEEFS